VPGLIAETAEADFDRMLDVNVKGAFLAAKHFLGQVDPSRGGQFVQISSVAGKTANPNAPLYCTAKAALDMFGKALALQAKAANVRVTTLSPGAVSTPGFWGDRPVPHEKFLQPQDVAESVAYVLSLPPHVVLHEMVFEPWEFYRSK
jgi:NADP-dependent 3-hydroxy acid dehydrogenase YdfG